MTMPGDRDFSTRWRQIKSRFARALPNLERLSAVRVTRHERGIWQRRFWEHLIRDEGRLRARHVEYCRINLLEHPSSRACATGGIPRFNAMSARECFPRIGPATATRAAISANDVDRAGGLRSADYAFGFNPPYGLTELLAMGDICAARLARPHAQSFQKLTRLPRSTRVELQGGACSETRRHCEV
jgi:hypothetical protein